MKNVLQACFAAAAKSTGSSISSISAGFLVAALLGGATAAQAQTVNAAGGYVRWTMAVNNQDSVNLRSTGISATSSSFRGLVVSNGVPPATGATYAPYSPSRGQAFAPAADGSGWPSASTPPGPGSLPRRTFYEQFTVTASAPIKIDSLFFTTAATSTANGRLAMMYSLSNFVSDSASLSGGKGPNYTPSPGGVLPPTADGTFGSGTTTATNYAALPQFVGATGNTGTFRFGFNGTAGLGLRAGQRLTLRMYFTINSSGTNRFILLKDVIMSGRAGTITATLPRAEQALNVYPNPAASRLTCAHTPAPAGASASVVSALGQRVLTAAVQPGSTSTSFDVSGLAAGIYLLEYTDGQQRFTSKIVKE